jgi:hypothetical protein
MADISYSYDLSARTVASGSEVQDNFDDVAGVVNGNLTNANLASNAAIAASKLAVSYQRMVVELKVTAGDLAAAAAFVSYPASGVLDVCPIYGTSGETAWTVEGIYWVTNGIGGGGADFDVQWGYYDGAGAWQNTASKVNGATQNINTYMGAATVAAGATCNFPDAQIRGLALVSTGADATMLNAAGKFLRVMVSLKRQITA